MFFWEGIKIGAYIVLPVGPVVILLLCMAATRSLRDFLIAQALLGCSIGCHVMLAMFLNTYIVVLVENFPTALYTVMGILVLCVAAHAHVSNKNIRYGEPSAAAVWWPAALSLVCPFTTVLVINLMVMTPTLSAELLLIEKLQVALGAALGSSTAYCCYGLLAYIMRQKANTWMQRAVLVSPLLIVFFGLSALKKALVSYFQ